MPITLKTRKIDQKIVIASNKVITTNLMLSICIGVVLYDYIININLTYNKHSTVVNGICNLCYQRNSTRQLNTRDNLMQSLILQQVD
jgi:hypothetical protein